MFQKPCADDEEELDWKNVDFAISFDSGPMFQEPRTGDEEATFRRALGGMDAPHAQQQTVKWRCCSGHFGIVASSRASGCREHPDEHTEQFQRVLPRPSTGS